MGDDARRREQNQPCIKQSQSGLAELNLKYVDSRLESFNIEYLSASLKGRNNNCVLCYVIECCSMKRHFNYAKLIASLGGPVECDSVPIYCRNSCIDTEKLCDILLSSNYDFEVVCTFYAPDFATALKWNNLVFALPVNAN